MGNWGLVPKGPNGDFEYQIKIRESEKIHKKLILTKEKKSGRIILQNEGEQWLLLKNKAKLDTK